MVRVNGNYNFNVYDLDTRKTIIDRMASEMKTIEKYLYFPDNIPNIKQFLEKDGEINVEDLFETITNDNVGYDFISIFNKIKDKLKQQKLDLITDIFIPFIVFNKILIDVPKNMVDVYLLMIQTEIDKSNIFTDIPNVNIIWENRYRTVQKIKKDINNNLLKTTKQKNLFIKFETISNIPSYSSFELERISFEFILDIVHVTIMEIFNHIKLNSTVPFACINNIFKIMKDFLPPIDWEFSSESVIIFKVLQKLDLSAVKITDYTDAFLSIMGDPGSEVISVGMTLNITNQNLSRDNLINRFLGVVKDIGEVKVKNIQEDRVNGVFYFPNRSLNKYVLAELIMNNQLFSSMISIDESEKASKKKESVYIHFKHPKTGYVTANITEKISEKGDPLLRGKDIKGEFKFGTKYIRVKISNADNLESIEEFQKIFAKLLVIYDKEFDTIIEFYKQYISNFGESISKPSNILQNIKLKDIAPEVFVKGYPPKCPHQPIIIDDDEVEDAKKDGKIVMRYPQDKKEGFIPHNYICENPKAKYPGLRDNPLSNRDIVPYLPCCYSKSHDERKGSIYRHYYYGEQLREKIDAGQQDLIVTNKFVPKDKYGTLPTDITKLFDIFDYREGYIYVRKGVFDTKSSFLDCVMEGMYEETNILELQDKDEREARLYDIRNSLANPSRAASCRQEMYDFKIDDIIKAIRDPDIYMDPKLFVSLLEDFFDCNIFVFNRTNIRNGKLSIPRHLQAYYKRKRNAKCIFVYEHIGSTSDHAKYPRCELIVRWKVGGGNEKDVTYYSNYNSSVAKGIRNIFNKMSKAYALNIKISEIDFLINNSDIKLSGQYIDSYGKCRMLHFKYKNKSGTIITDPLPPLNTEELKKWIVTKKLDRTLALQFASDMKIIISEQTVENDILKEIHGYIDTFKISIPIEDSVPIDGIPTLDKEIVYPKNEISVIDNYNYSKKLTRYIIEYTFWLFSKYLQEDSSRDMGIETIKNFVEEKIKIVTNFKYGNVSKIFSMNSVVMDNQKLVLTSEESLKRLVYLLRVSIRRFRQKIKNYYKRQVIEKYYVDITDFDKYSFQVIVQGENSISKWINEQKIKYNLYDSVQVGILETPYFFKNSLIDKNIYLVQNTDNIQKAINIVSTWLQSNYNPRNNVTITNSQLVKYTLYSYVKPTNIKKYIVDGLPTPLDIKILGYKIGENSFFGALLPFV